MDGLLFLAFVVGLVGFFYTKLQIKELTGHIDHAQKRVVGAHDNQEQRDMDARHIVVWVGRVTMLRKLNKAATYLGFGSVGMFLVVRAVQYAVAYGWIR